MARKNFCHNNSQSLLLGLA